MRLPDKALPGSIAVFRFAVMLLYGIVVKRNNAMYSLAKKSYTKVQWVYR